jgi:hypothetical protein
MGQNGNAPEAGSNEGAGESGQTLVAKNSASTPNSKSATQKSKAKGVLRGQKLTPENYKHELRVFCESEFRKGLGVELQHARGLKKPVDWSDSLVTGFRWKVEPNEGERDARRAWRELQKAMIRAVEVARKVGSDYQEATQRKVEATSDHEDDRLIHARNPGPCQRFLSHWVIDNVEPLTKHYSFAGVTDEYFDRMDRGAQHNQANDRARLIRTFDYHNMFGLWRPDGSGRFLSSRELAIISILGGNEPGIDWRPNAKRPTAAEIVAQEEKNIAKLMPTYAQGPRQILPWDDYLREFGIEPTDLPEPGASATFESVELPVWRGSGPRPEPKHPRKAQGRKGPKS